MHYKRLQSLIANHMQQEHSESAQEQRIALYKRVNSNNSTSVGWSNLALPVFSEILADTAPDYNPKVVGGGGGRAGLKSHNSASYGIILPAMQLSSGFALAIYGQN